MTYQFRQFTIRDEMMESLTEYVVQHLPVGGFLSAVISNDLHNAVGYADDDNLANLPAFAGWLYNVAPSDCWGSREKMQAWLKARDPVG